MQLLYGKTNQDIIAYIKMNVKKVKNADTINKVHMNNMLHLLILHFVSIVKHWRVLYALIQNNTHSVCYIHISA